MIDTKYLPNATPGQMIRDSVAVCTCHYLAHRRKYKRLLIIPRYYYLCGKCGAVGPDRITKKRAARAFVKKIGG